MPAIRDQTLSIERSGTSATIMVDLDIGWEEWERLSGQEYVLQVEMWGEDGPQWWDPDNRLFAFGFPFLTNGRRGQEVTVRTLVPVRDLDEDTGPDEVYARLTLRPTRSFGTASAKTNTVTANFSP
jgi:hypothetical protein